LTEVFHFWFDDNTMNPTPIVLVAETVHKPRSQRRMITN